MDRDPLLIERIAARSWGCAAQVAGISVHTAYALSCNLMLVVRPACSTRAPCRITRAPRPASFCWGESIGCGLIASRLASAPCGVGRSAAILGRALKRLACRVSKRSIRKWTSSHYERAVSGQLSRIDIKKLVRIVRPVPSRRGRSRGYNQRRKLWKFAKSLSMIAHVSASGKLILTNAKTPLFRFCKVPLRNTRRSWCASSDC